MALAPPSSFLRRLLTAPRPQDDDPADMGTAWGLEASLGPVSDYPPRDPSAPRLAAADDDEEPPMGWLGRSPKRPR